MGQAGDPTSKQKDQPMIHDHEPVYITLDAMVWRHRPTFAQVINSHLKNPSP
jgi:hypothetical protein